MRTKRIWFSAKLAAITLLPFGVTSLLGFLAADKPYTLAQGVVTLAAGLFLIVLNIAFADAYKRN